MCLRSMGIIVWLFFLHRIIKVVFYVVLYIKLYELADLKQNMASTWTITAPG